MKRIKLSRAAGWRKPENTVVVSRPSKWGNPFPIDSKHDRAASIAKFDVWIRRSAKGRKLAEAARKELRGKNLACWCPLDGPCHADTLLRIANK